MRLLKTWLFAALCLCPVLLPAQDDTGLKNKIKWLKGPAQANLENIAQVQVPQGYVFAGAADTRRILEAMGNRTRGVELGFITPDSIMSSNWAGWFLVFEFSDVGFVKDDDKDKLDGDKILKAIKRGTEESNKYRKGKGIPEMHVIGWEQPPKYNPETHNLEWAIRAESEGEQVINYNTRLLGRKGVMEVALVVDPDKLQATLPKFQELLTAYSFKQGETYAEYKKGDKLATYGLAGLVTAGAAVVAVKTGLLTTLLLLGKKLWVLVVAAVAGVVNWFKRLVQGGGRRKSTLE